MRRLLPLILLVFLIFSGCEPVVLSHSIDFKDVEADGTGPRAEREFKYSLSGRNLAKYDTEELAELINEVLGEEVDNAEVWQAPKFTETFYYTDDEAEAFAYFDIYFDTEDALAFNNAISYRLRERFKDLDDYYKHLDDQTKKKYLPYRIEFQAKVGRQELGDGFSTVNESRFEFREESEPFSEDNPPPSAPWDLDEFIRYFQAGKFQDYYTWSAKAVVDYLMPERTDKTELYFEPVLILVTERHRQHLNIKSDWGSGPNPEQSYIVTLDNSEVYEASSYLEYMKGKKLGYNAEKPEYKGRFIEIEVEFERNVSTVLDEKIEEYEAAGNVASSGWLKQVRDAFLADQKVIMEVIKNHLAVKGIRVEPANKSKYQQAYKYL